MNNLSTTLLGTAFALVILFFAVPMVAGGSTDVCQAVESHDVKTTAQSISGSNSGTMYNVINSVGQAGATGDIERQTQANAHPNTPTVVSCTVAFWKTL